MRFNKALIVGPLKADGVNPVYLLENVAGNCNDVAKICLCLTGLQKDFWPCAQLSGFSRLREGNLFHSTKTCVVHECVGLWGRALRHGCVLSQPLTQGIYFYLFLEVCC